MVIWTTAAWAADVTAGANVLAAGGVGVAAPADNVGITLNPGTLGMRSRYDFSALFRYGPTGGIGWGATAMDARTSDAVAAGFAYSGSKIEPPLTPNDLPGWKVILPGGRAEHISNVYKTHDFCGAIGVPFAHRHVSLGIAV